MNRDEIPPASLDTVPAPRAVTAGALVVLTLSTWLAVPVLRQFDDALVPWPAHGLAVAILFSAQRPIRGRAALGILAAITLGAMIGGGSLPSSVAAAALVCAQTIVALVLYELLAKGQPPLSGSIPYAWFLFAAVIGTLPTTLVASATMQMIGPGVAPGYTTLVWWMSAMSSVLNSCSTLITIDFYKKANPNRSESQLVLFGRITTGVIVVLSKRKPTARKDKIVLLNASKRLKKGKPKNYIPEDDVRPLAAAFLKGEPVEGEIIVIDRKQAEDADYNLSPSRWVGPGAGEEGAGLKDILDRFEAVTATEADIARDLNVALAKLREFA